MDPDEATVRLGHLWASGLFHLWQRVTDVFDDALEDDGLTAREWVDHLGQAETVTRIVGGLRSVDERPVLSCVVEVVSAGLDIAKNHLQAAIDAPNLDAPDA